MLPSPFPTIPCSGRSTPSHFPLTQPGSRDVQTEPWDEHLGPIPIYQDRAEYFVDVAAAAADATVASHTPHLQDKQGLRSCRVLPVPWAVPAVVILSMIVVKLNLEIWKISGQNLWALYSSGWRELLSRQGALENQRHWEKAVGQSVCSSPVVIS